MTTLHLKKSKAQSPLRLGLLLAALVLAFFAIPDRAYAVDGPPTVQTLGVTFKASFSARLNSGVDPNGLASVHFQYGTTTDYGLTTAPETASGHSLRPLDADISGLAADTTYHFRVVASNADGTSVGVDRIFQTLTETGRPVVMTRPATRITSSSAALNGVLDPHGSHTSVSFEYGPTTNYGFTTSAPTEIGNTFRNIDANVSGLAADTTYHFRIVTSNAHGTTFSTDRAFTTLIPTGPPVIAFLPSATRIASFSARLISRVDPHGLATTVHFEYGTTTDYGLTTAPQTLTGSAYRGVDADISGLAADTRYYFRVVASNAAGTVFSVLPGHFTTLTPTGPPVVTIEPATNVTASRATLHGVVDPHGLTTRFFFQKIFSQNATLIQTLTDGNEYRDIAADWDHLPPDGERFRLVAVNSAGRAESKYIDVHR